MPSAQACSGSILHDIMTAVNLSAMLLVYTLYHIYCMLFFNIIVELVLGSTSDSGGVAKVHHGPVRIVNGCDPSSFVCFYKTH